MEPPDSEPIRAFLPLPHLSGTSEIGKSPIAPHAQVVKTERASYHIGPRWRSSFMTFGGRRASQTPHTPHPPPSPTILPHPTSAHPALLRFPETRLPSPDQYQPPRLPRGSALVSGYHTPLAHASAHAPTQDFTPPLPRPLSVPELIAR